MTEENKAGHTPGPWIVYIGEDDFDVLPAGRPGEIAARIGNTRDASLIAAAPDMLAALRWAEATLAPFSKSPTEKSGIAQIRTAIAKATGQ